MRTPRVQLRTPYGGVEIAVFADAAPASAGYFLADVRRRRYDGSSFFRVVRPEDETEDAARAISVVQAGLRPPPDGMLDSVAHEPTGVSGLRHERGTVSLARFGPGAVYGSFFVCLREEPSLDEGGARQPDGAGFAAFGRVTSGLDVVERIAAQLGAGYATIAIHNAWAVA